MVRELCEEDANTKRRLATSLRCPSDGAERLPELPLLKETKKIKQTGSCQQLAWDER